MYNLFLDGIEYNRKSSLNDLYNPLLEEIYLVDTAPPKI